MKISVIIPTYKPGSYFNECLHSLGMQTLDAQLWEVIIVLNGSDELGGVKSLIDKELSGKSARFIHTSTPGVSNARNMALDMAKGEYVAFIDDDDYVSPSYLSELLSISAQDTIALSYPYAFDDGQPEKQLPYSITEAYQYVRQHPDCKVASKVRKYLSGPCMKLIPMSFIQSRRFDVQLANREDSLFIFLISDRFKKFAVTSPSAVYYRRYRTGSANSKLANKSYYLNNLFKYCWKITKVYFSSPLKYNLVFYATRIIGGLKSIIKL